MNCTVTLSGGTLLVSYVAYTMEVPFTILGVS